MKIDVTGNTTLKVSWTVNPAVTDTKTFLVTAYAQDGTPVARTSSGEMAEFTGLKPYTNYMIELKLQEANLPPLQQYARTKPGGKTLFYNLFTKIYIKLL